MRFRILGQLDIAADQQRVLELGPRERRALAILLLGGGHVVPASRLIDAIWNDKPPARAGKQLSNVVYRLRRALASYGTAGQITAGMGGYRLQVADGDLDAAVFEAAVVTAGRQAADGRVGEAADTLRRALSLWRGPALAGLEGAVLEAAATGLNQRRLSAQAAYASHLLELGRNEEAAADLVALVAEDPEREDLVALLMTALYRCGRQADALNLYARTRTRLVQELGIEPGTVLQNLHRRVLANAADAAGHTGSPPAEPSRPGRADTSAGPHAVPAAPQVRHSLPADTAAFTGRGGELGRITSAVQGAAGGGGVVTVGAIDGMPGVGKTTLAVRVAHALAGQFPDRQLFVDLHGHTPGREPVTAMDALAGLLAATGEDARNLPTDLAGRAGMWRDRMAGQQALLVLDNAASSSQVTPLLPGGGCLVLVTSRRHLGDLPGAVTPIMVDVLPPQDAADMFLRLAPRAVGDREGVAEVVALAGFLPLAVSLLARLLARHPSRTVTDLVAETKAGVLTLAAEDHSVAAAFDVSYRYLGLDAQRLFQLLSVHPGTTFDVYAAAALADLPLAEAAGLLDGLHGEGLLTETGHRRYGMHDLIRRYARDHAVATLPAQDAQRALGRLLDYYQRTAARADIWLARQVRPGPPPATPPGEPHAAPDLDDIGRALAWARGERADLLACLDYATRADQHAHVVALTAALAGLFRRDGPWDDAITRHTTALHAARRLGDRLGQANALHDLGVMRLLTDDYPAAAQDLQQALSIYHDLSDRLGQAHALYNLGAVRRLAGDYPGAAEALEQALGIYRDLSDRLGQAKALSNLGAVWLQTGDYPGAARALEQALSISHDLSDLLGQAHALNSLGAVWRMTGDYLGAAQALEQALSIFRDLSDQRGEAAALVDLGGVRLLTGDSPGAAQALELGLRIYHDLGNRSGQATALNETGTLHRVSGDLARAQGCHQQALELARAIASSWDEAHALAGLSRCATAADHPAQAETLLRQALEIFQQTGAAETSDLLAELDTLMARIPAVRAANQV